MQVQIAHGKTENKIIMIKVVLKLQKESIYFIKVRSIASQAFFIQLIY